MAKQRGVPGGREREANADKKGVHIPFPGARSALSRPGLSRPGGSGGDGVGGDEPQKPCDENSPGFPDCLTTDMSGVVKRVLVDVDVEAISLVPAAANRRAFIAKSAEKEGLAFIEKEVQIVKTDKARRMVYGVVYAPKEADADGDAMTPEEVEKAAYRFMKSGRTGEIDADHDGKTGKGFVAESWIVRKGDPVLPDEVPGAWAVGIKVTDEDVWKRVEKGELKGLSMFGKAKAYELKKADEEDVSTPSGFLAALRKLFGADALAQADAEAQAGEAAVSEPVEKDCGCEGEPVGGPETDPASVDELAKGFKEKLFQNQLWRVTEALGDAVKEVLRDENLTGNQKVAAVRAVLSEFETFVMEQLGEAVAKGAGEAPEAEQGQGPRRGPQAASAVNAPPERGASGARASAVDDATFAGIIKSLSAIEERLDKVAQMQDQALGRLAERLALVESQTGGSQVQSSQIGKRERKEKGFKGIEIPL